MSRRGASLYQFSPYSCKRGWTNFWNTIPPNIKKLIMKQKKKKKEENNRIREKIGSESSKQKVSDRETKRGFGIYLAWLSYIVAGTRVSGGWTRTEVNTSCVAFQTNTEFKQWQRRRRKRSQNRLPGTTQPSLRGTDEVYIHLQRIFEQSDYQVWCVQFLKSEQYQYMRNNREIQKNKEILPSYRTRKSNKKKEYIK